MTSKPVAFLMADLGITKTHSRPHVSDDNSYSESLMSGNTLDIMGQLGYVAKVRKLANHDRNILSAIDVVEMATMGGARALHMEDLIVLNHNSTTMMPFYDVYSTLVYAASAHDVRTTIIQGRVIMEDREFKTVDAADVREHMRELSRRIAAATEARR